MDTCEVVFLEQNTSKHNVGAENDCSKLITNNSSKILIRKLNTSWRVSNGLKDFKHTHKQQSSFQCILSQFVVSTTLGRQKTAAYSVWIGLALSWKKIYAGSPRQTVGVGRDGVRLWKGSLYALQAKKNYWKRFIYLHINVKK